VTPASRAQRSHNCAGEEGGAERWGGHSEQVLPSRWASSGSREQLRNTRAPLKKFNTNHIVYQKVTFSRTPLSLQKGTGGQSRNPNEPRGVLQIHKIQVWWSPERCPGKKANDKKSL